MPERSRWDLDYRLEDLNRVIVIRSGPAEADYGRGAVEVGLGRFLSNEVGQWPRSVVTYNAAHNVRLALYAQTNSPIRTC